MKAWQSSCCKWGRANGWTMMAKAEVLSALPPAHSGHGAVLADFVAHARALAKVQDAADGRWHQILNDPTT
jgi:rhamnogalacturonyl hydrolase YesR